MINVDWVTIRQEVDDPRSLPDWGESRVLRLDADGALEWETMTANTVEGSYDTSCRIRAYNGVYEWSGNPSRWDRPDNVWGFDCLRDAVDLVINPLMSDQGLPQFASREAYGAKLTRVDLCANYEAGSDASAVLRAISQQTWYGRAPQTYGPSMQWGSRRHTLIKWYDKAAELRAHTKRNAPHVVRDYRAKLADYCEQVGLLRFEVALGRDGLRRLDMRDYWGWCDKKAESYVQSVVDKMMPDAGAGGLEDIASELVRLGLCSDRLAVQLQGYAYQWASGVDIWSLLNHKTRYRYRAILRKVGIDIRRPLQDVTSLKLQPRVCELKPAQPPIWYWDASTGGFAA